MARHLQPDNRDPLTGAATEAALLRFTEAVLDIVDPGGPPVSFLLIDIDGLPIIGTQLGGQVGDAVLLGVADRLHEGIRGHDLVGRVAHGFGICMPDLPLAQARRVAERLRQRLAGVPLPTPRGDLRITCSIGLTFGQGPALQAVALLARARLAVQEAQRAGGNRVVAAT